MEMLVTGEKILIRTVPCIGFATALAAALMLPGCGGGREGIKIEDYLEEMEFDTPLESVKDVKIGSYRISCAARHQDPSGLEAVSLWVQVQFTLYAEASYEDEKAILAACERHRGMLDDAVLTIFRKASIDELSDNRWTTLKAKLIDDLRPLLGEKRVRQIFFDDFSWEPI